MPALIQHKINAIIEEIDRRGHADVLRLTVLKRWFMAPGRLSDFGLWIAQQAAAHGEAATGDAGSLFAEARALLEAREPPESGPRWSAAETLYRRLRLFQNTFQHQRWGPVRIIWNRNLLLVEQGLALYLRHLATPTDGYRLAVGYCAHYDARFGTDLNGPSRDRLAAVRDFIATVELREKQRA